MSILRFQRATYLVSDLEKALEFYRDILGFEVEYIIGGNLESYSYEVFEIERDVAIRFATLNTETQPRVMALAEVPGLHRDQPLPRRSAVVIEVEDIDRVVSESKAAGFKVHDEDHLVTPDGREGREIGIVDADGNLVVIYWITRQAGAVE